MDNYVIADQFSMLSKLMEIHGENAFKAKSYASAAFTIEKLPQSLAELPAAKISSIRGIGESVGKKVLEIIETGELATLNELVAKTPQGVLDLMNIKGLGPKKINLLWKELDIDSIRKLKKACEENRISEQKGFGDKTQQKILESIQFLEQNTGRYLYAQIESFAEAFKQKLQEEFPDARIEVTGSFRRQLEIIDKLEWVTTISKKDLVDFLTASGLTILQQSDDVVVANAEATLQIVFHLADEKNFATRLFTTSGSEEFLAAFKNLHDWSTSAYDNEEAMFTVAGLSYLPPFLRETKSMVARAKKEKLPALIETSDIKGLVHSHSNWSDGAHTIEEMAEALIKLGFEYLVLSDHSKAAYYANGLTEQKIKEQHKLIDELNKKLFPFKIFKSIECDILSDGSLDYPDEILASFDLVIASIHSNLQMTEEKAMMRLLSAIANPYVTIMGHLTGRRLLRRASYPVDHKAIIDACAENAVAIEINANPQRLDMEWQWIDYALEKNLFLSINPDAHTIDEFYNIKYGVLVAQKGGLTKEHNLSSLSREAFETFLQQRKKLKGLS